MTLYCAADYTSIATTTKTESTIIKEVFGAGVYVLHEFVFPVIVWYLSFRNIHNSLRQ